MLGVRSSGVNPLPQSWQVYCSSAIEPYWVVDTRRLLQFEHFGMAGSVARANAYPTE